MPGNKKPRLLSQAGFFYRGKAGLHHAAHATHTAHVWHTAASRAFIFDLSDHGFGGDHQAGDGSRCLKSRTSHFSRVKDAHFDHVAVFAGSSVVTVVTRTLLDLVDYYAWLVAGVGNDLTQWRFNSATQQLDTNVLIGVVAFQFGDSLQSANQCHATARYHAFFNGCTSSVQGVFNAGFLLFHFNFGTSANLDHRNAARQLGQTLLQFLFVVVRSGVADLLADLSDARVDIGFNASTVDDGGVFFVQDDALGITQVFQGSAFQAQADLFGDNGTASQDSDVLEHCLATVAEAWSLDGCNFHDTAHVVHNQSRQGFAFDVFGNDQQRTASFGHCFQNWQHFADVGDFLVDQQDQRAVQLGNHGVRLVDEVRGQVATVELHAFNNRQFVFQARTFFNGDNAVFGHFFHGFGNDVADGVVRVGRNGTNLSNCLGVGAWLGQQLELSNDGDGRLVDAALQVHRVHAGSDGFQAFVDDSLSQNGSSGSTVTSVIVGTGGNVFDQLRAHVFETVFEFDFFGYGNAVLGDGRSAEALLDDHVTAFRAQGRFYCVSQDVYTGEHFLAGGVAEFNFFSSHDRYSLNTL